MSEMREVLKGLSREISASLPDVSTLSLKQLAYVLLVYDSMIRPHFVPLLANAWTRCKSTEARQACADNILCEVNENHPQMLADFARVALSIATREDIEQYVRSNGYGHMEELNTLTMQQYDSALPALIILAALENTSLVFIPWLEEAAKRLGAVDLTYTQKHGEADIKHADQFIEAVEAELKAERSDVTFSEIFERPLWAVQSALMYIFQAYRI